ncbi:MAG: GtrA family protein [Candidatus Eisenbacteria bacterium]
MRVPIGPLRRLLGRKLWLRQFIKFCLVGLTGLAVDTSVLAFFTEVVPLDPRAAAIPAFAVAVTWTYSMNRLWTFRAGSGGGVGASYASFVGICLAGLALRLLTMHLLMEYAGLGTGRRYYLASLAGIFVATFWNFAGSKFVAFRKR